jgi:hypothetical protein
MSIYSSPLGDQHLERRLCADPHESDGLIVRVVRSGVELLGCTIVSIRDGKRHLDYVATVPSAAGSGLGSLLLSDALNTAQGPLSLDVFESNHAVREWYLRRGFTDLYERVVQVLDLRRVPATTEWDPGYQKAVTAARESELAQGFGEFTIGSGSDNYRFGLLGERNVRLFEYPTGKIADAAAVARGALPDREHLALPIGLRHEGLPTYFADQLIRMESQP